MAGHVSAVVDGVVLFVHETDVFTRRGNSIILLDLNIQSGIISLTEAVASHAWKLMDRVRSRMHGTDSLLQISGYQRQTEGTTCRW